MYLSTPCITDSWDCQCCKEVSSSMCFCLAHFMLLFQLFHNCSPLQNGLAFDDTFDPLAIVWHL